MATVSLVTFGLKSLSLKPKFIPPTLHLPSLKCRATSSIKLSSSQCISQFSFSPLVLGKKFAHIQTNSQTLTIVSAKGYKMKTHKASAKRFRVSGSGKIMRRRAGKQHLLRKKNTKRRKRLSKMVQVDRSDYNNVIGALPYLKVNRSN